MPTVLRIRGFRFFFFSNEGRERPHVHVRKGEAYAKVWLDTARIVDERNLSPSQSAAIRAIVEQHRSGILRAWHEHFGGPGTSA